MNIYVENVNKTGEQLLDIVSKFERFHDKKTISIFINRQVDRDIDRYIVFYILKKNTWKMKLNLLFSSLSEKFLEIN